MPDSFIAIGCDSSKGRIDVEIRNSHHSILHTGAYDDTPDGHDHLRRTIEGLRQRHPKAVFLAGIESTGGMERNWLKFFRREKRWVKQMRVFRLNAASVHAFRAADLHHAPGDAAAARDIARYLLERCTRRVPQQEADSGPIVFYRTIRAMVREQTMIHQRIQTLLVSTHPDLVRFCRHGLPAWVLALIERYPTAASLARARAAAVDAIPHIDAERAADLIANAKKSVASLTDAASSATMRMLVADAVAKQRRIDDAQREFLEIIGEDAESPLATAVKMLDAIPGIGTWSAACLACEIGDARRFPTANAIVSWAGLDPTARESGDERHEGGISHRGNAHVRAMLFPLAMTGVVHNAVLKAFNERLLAKGKTRLEALVAVMAKILRIAHAVLLTGKPFDPEHEAKRRSQVASIQAARSAAAQPPVDVGNPVVSLNSPISRREAKKRKQAAARGAEMRDQSPKRVPAGEPQIHSPETPMLPRVS